MLNMEIVLSFRKCPNVFSFLQLCSGCLKCQIFISLEICFETGLPKGRTPSLTDQSDSIEPGDRVIVAGQRKGTVRFVGETKFAPGMFAVASCTLTFKGKGNNNPNLNTIHKYSEIVFFQIFFSSFCMDLRIGL